MNRNAYTSLASVYDRLNADIDYGAWADYIERQFGRYMPQKPISVLDLACGTGSMTVELARRGYDMTGVDLSDDMLAAARAKCEAEHFRHSVLLIRQNMSDLELYGTVQAVVCCLDSMNYLTATDQLIRTLDRVHTYLEPNGLFLFDMNAPAKFERVYGEQAYILEEDGILCAWQNEYHPKSRICNFYLSIFEEDPDGRWQRFDEVQQERCFALRTVKKMLTDAGFELCALTSDWNDSPVDADTERWYFTVRAVK